MRQTFPKRLFCMMLFLAFLAVSASLPQAHAVVTVETRYFQIVPYLQYAYGMYAFLPWTNDDYGMANYTATTTGDKKVQWGIRVGLNDRNGTYTPISGLNQVAIVERSTNGEGWQNATWNCPETNTTMRSDVLIVSIYRRYQTFGIAWSAWALMNGTTTYGSWAMSQFITEGLGATRLNASTWTVHYWTGRSYTTSTKYWFYWGNSTYNARAENIQYDDGVTAPTNNLPSGFMLGAIIMIPISIILAITLRRRH